MIKPLPKLELKDFNNLTKTLSFNIYDICYAHDEAQQRGYIEYIDEEYNSDRLTKILTDVCDIVGATVLNIARQDFEPQGSSVTMLISEVPQMSEGISNTEAPGPLPEAVLSETVLSEAVLSEAIVAHLDKSHITVHTYPESHPDSGISTFRVDIDVSTCGRISPLKALNYLIHSFDSDIVTMDYRVRGFTRDVDGLKHYIDHEINSIQNFIAEDTQERYEMLDVNVYQENIFHTKMMLKKFELDNYLFGVKEKEMKNADRDTIKQRLKKEMLEIFYGRNIA